MPESVHLFRLTYPADMLLCNRYNVGLERGRAEYCAEIAKDLNGKVQTIDICSNADDLIVIRTACTREEIVGLLTEFGYRVEYVTTQ